jgi:hypothetical protein
VHGSSDATLSVNGREVLRDGRAVTVALSGGINKVTVTGRLRLDRLEFTPSSLPTQV